MSLKDYYERFCNRLDNPTFNMLEVEIKRTLYGATFGTINSPKKG